MGPVLVSNDNFNQSENNQSKGDVYLPSSSTQMGCEMAVINRVNIDQITSVQLLLYRLDPKPKQDFEGIEKLLRRKIVSYFDLVSSLQ